MNKKTVDIQRLSLDLDLETHTIIKTKAAEKNITMRKWVIRAIIKQIEKEKSYE